MSTFRLSIVTPEKEFYSGEIEYLCVDTPDGKAGFMRGAMPRIVALSSGHIVIKTSVIETDIICGDGLICVGDDEITVISEKCVYANDDGHEDSDAAVNKLDGAKTARMIDKAKAGIAASIKKMRDKKSDD